jgi:hypothetical protein
MLSPPAILETRADSVSKTLMLLVYGLLRRPRCAFSE